MSSSPNAKAAIGDSMSTSEANIRNSNGTITGNNSQHNSIPRDSIDQRDNETMHKMTGASRQQSTDGPKVYTVGSEGNEAQFTLYKYRHFELTLYSLTAIIAQMCWISLQPVPAALESGYGKGDKVISTIGIIFVLVFIPVNFPSNFVIDKGGLKIGVSKIARFRLI